MNGSALIRAAGGVLWRPAPSEGDAWDIEVAVVHRPRYDDWCLPKGKLAQGESDLGPRSARCSRKPGSTLVSANRLARRATDGS